MWHLFDRYKGVVWPKARQLNLIAKILNNLCQGTGIKLDMPTNPSPAAPVTIGIDMEWLDERIGEASAGVDSVNGEDGALTVNGGKNIRVDTADKVITISYEEDKEPDEDAVGEKEQPDCNDWSGGDGEGGEPAGAEWGDDDGGVSSEAQQGGKSTANQWSGEVNGVEGGDGAGGGGWEDAEGDGNGWGGDSCAELNGWD